MADEKKLTNEEIKNEALTDEEANQVAGGCAVFRQEFTCASCGKHFQNATLYQIEGKPNCLRCYSEYRQDYKTKGPIDRL